MPKIERIQSVRQEARNPSEPDYPHTSRKFDPAWVADLGCNTGEFSLMAADLGVRVVAIDADPVCVNALYRKAKQHNQYRRKIHPLVANLSHFSRSFGINGTQYEGLLPRLGRAVDCVLALAVTHHLMIKESISADKVFEMLSNASKSWAIIELVAPEDSQALLLSRQRNRPRATSSIAEQLSILDRYFTAQEQVSLTNGKRCLVLAKRRFV